MAKKIAFLFPGQGSQYAGMGKDFTEIDSCKDLYKKANTILGFDITSLCLNGPEEELLQTQNTQPAILLVSAAAHKLLAEKGVSASWAAGHSLGEYSALLATSAISFKDAITIVRKRGTFMQEAAAEGTGAMAAIIGLDSEKLDTVCKKAEEVGFVKPANYNSPIQTVIAGETKAVQAAMVLAKEAGAKRALLLPVSAPFHTELLSSAEEKLDQALQHITFSTPSIPVIANVSALPVTKKDEIIQSLKHQVCSPVRWVESMQYLIDQGVDTFIEIGPGKVLSGLLKRINKEVRSFSVEDMDSLEKTVEAI